MGDPITDLIQIIVIGVGEGATNVPSGGTGQSSLTNHAVLIGAGTGAVNTVGPGTSGQVLTSNGASDDPSFQTLSINADDPGTITGVVPVSAGGTGNISFTFGGVMVGNNASTLQVTSAGTTNQVLASNGSAAYPTFKNVSSVLPADVVYNDVANVFTVGPQTVQMSDDNTALSIRSNTVQTTPLIDVHDGVGTNILRVGGSSNQMLIGAASATFGVRTDGALITGAAVTPGSLTTTVKKIAVYDTTNSLIGYIPIMT